MAIYHPVGAKHFRIQCSLLRWVKNNVPNRSVQTYYSKDPPFTDPNLPSHFLISAYILQKRTQGDPGDLLDRDFWAKGWQESLTAILAEPFKALCSSSASQSWQIMMGWNSVKGEKAAPPEAHSWRHNLASVAVHILLGKKKKAIWYTSCPKSRNVEGSGVVRPWADQGHNFVYSVFLLPFSISMSNQNH